MKNPFKAAGDAVAGMFASTDRCDFFNHRVLKVGAVIVTPIVAPVVFVVAMFQKKESVS